VAATEPASNVADLEQLREMSTGQIADAMAELGLARSACRGRWAEIPNRRVVGRAFPVQFRPAASKQDFDEYMHKVSPGDIIMLANGGRSDCAVWGGRRTLAAMQRGALATFIDGAVRDVEEHREAGYPIYARHVSPLRSRGIVAPASAGETVTFAGALVRWGDVVVGDASGVIVVPTEHAVSVIAAALRIRDFEKSTEDALRAGARLEEIYPPDGSGSKNKGDRP
jgi:4-hydroxy-4-methyl-2-oxoglutarate aldolase